jgi:hypothetical protein
MSKDYFSKEYQSEPLTDGTSGEPNADKNTVEANEKDFFNEMKYGSRKPKRIIIKAIIVDDKN